MNDLLAWELEDERRKWQLTKELVGYSCHIRWPHGITYCGLQENGNTPEDAIKNVLMAFRELNP